MVELLNVVTVNLKDYGRDHDMHMLWRCRGHVWLLAVVLLSFEDVP